MPQLQIAPLAIAPTGTPRAAAVSTPGSSRADQAVILVPAGSISRIPGARVILIPAGSGARLGAAGLTDRVPTAIERTAAESALEGARQFFTKLGVGADEGNDASLKIRYLDNYPNASYMRTSSGEESMNIGINPKTNTSYAMAEDVIAHEYAHRIVRHILNQPGVGEAGVVNESLADTFAAAIDTKNWTIGEAAQPKGIRSMIDPGRVEDELHLTRDQVIRRPDSMDKYLKLSMNTDKGGVHINVGIPNKAAALIGESLGREAMAKIYLEAIRSEMPQGGGIRELAEATAASASQLFGASSRQHNAVLDAWSAVGVLQP